MCSQVCPLPLYSNQQFKVTIFRLFDDDPAKYDVVETFKMFFMMSDVRNITDLDRLTEGEIGIMDFKGFSFRHFLKVASNLSTVRLYLKYVQEAVPFKIHQNHFLNCSPVLTRTIAMVRPFLNKELFNVMHFHTNGIETLHDYVSKEILPLEYGGCSGSYETFFKDWLNLVDGNREYLNNDLNWKLGWTNKGFRINDQHEFASKFCLIFCSTFELKFYSSDFLWIINGSTKFRRRRITTKPEEKLNKKLRTRKSLMEKFRKKALCAFP